MLCAEWLAHLPNSSHESALQHPLTHHLHAWQIVLLLWAASSGRGAGDFQHPKLREAYQGLTRVLDVRFNSGRSAFQYFRAVSSDKLRDQAVVFWSDEIVGFFGDLLPGSVSQLGRKKFGAHERAAVVEGGLLKRAEHQLGRRSAAPAVSEEVTNAKKSKETPAGGGVPGAFNSTLAQLRRHIRYGLHLERRVLDLFFQRQREVWGPRWDHGGQGGTTEEQESENRRAHEEQSEGLGGLCLAITDCVVKRQNDHTSDLHDKDRTQCEFDRGLVMGYAPSANFVRSAMDLVDLVNLIFYQIAITLKGGVVAPLDACDIRYYVEV